MRNRCLRTPIVGFLVWMTGCCPVRKVDPTEQIVTAPLTERANIVLANLTEDCYIVNRHWAHDMGCTLRTARYSVSVWGCIAIVRI